MPQTIASRPSASPSSSSRHDGPLSAEERDALTRGGFMSRLPSALVDAILARVRVWRLADGEPILSTGQAVDHWIGIAAGSALVFFQVPHLETLQCTNWVPAGVWFNLYNPAALTVSDVDVRAQGPAAVVALDAQDLEVLCQRFPELSRELAVANSGNLRRALQVLIASQRATLRQRQLFWLIELMQGLAAVNGASRLSVLHMSQDALARWHGVSRQAWCEGMKALEQEGLVQRTPEGALSADVAALEAAMEAETRAVEAPYVAAGAPPWPPAASSEPVGQPAALALRTAERERICRGRWFSSLALPLQHELIESSRVRRLSQGELLLRANEPPAGAWLVIDGAIRLENPLAAPPHRTIALLPPGSWHSFHDLAYRSTSVFDATALEPTTLLWLPVEAFERLFIACLDFRLAITRLLALQQSQAARYAASFFWPIEARVGIWLHMMHFYFDMHSGQGKSIAASFTLDDVAQWLGTTRQAISRQFKLLEQQGVIRRERGQFEVLKPQELPRLLPA
ncbi:Crp/Fnr family transcriptional regulator [Ideonella sp. YS5]|uniref:Crp/Fnr family transcriptional regulator n=1 Tax=Ideonella sp. YS5 TaxID=3453714 RepID=UPI003EEB815F